jgi:MFS family permease
MLGGIFAWPVADYLGRQAALMIGGIPGFVGWILISLSVLFSRRMDFFAMVYAGRALTGFSAGWSIYCVSVSIELCFQKDCYIKYTLYLIH